MIIDETIIQKEIETLKKIKNKKIKKYLFKELLTDAFFIFKDYSKVLDFLQKNLNDKK